MVQGKNNLSLGRPEEKGEGVKERSGSSLDRCSGGAALVEWAPTCAHSLLPC